VNGEYIPINYNHLFPFDTIEKDETVVIVDFSLQKDGDFEKLLEITPNVIWIDHHKTAIERFAYIDGKIKGIRRNGTSGCELTWEYFFSMTPVPRVVELLGDYDIWAFRYGDKTNWLQAGIRLFNTHPASDMWNIWLDPSYNPVKEIEYGKISIKYRNNYYVGLVKAFSFCIQFEGYKTIVCNAGSVSSQLFDSIREEYEIMMTFVFDGKMWNFSLYTKNKDIDVSEIAKKYGGGGHRQAAGFICDNTKFNQIIHAGHDN
jgi:oligoribonuclease NrnB/cAMP/cGMP phosphodiesterase (DHH superfamily)